MCKSANRQSSLPAHLEHRGSLREFWSMMAGFVLPLGMLALLCFHLDWMNATIMLVAFDVVAFGAIFVRRYQDLGLRGIHMPLLLLMALKILMLDYQHERNVWDGFCARMEHGSCIFGTGTPASALFSWALVKGRLLTAAAALYASWILVQVLGVPGTEGPNRYGPEPASSVRKLPGPIGRLRSFFLCPRGRATRAEFWLGCVRPIHAPLLVLTLLWALSFGGDVSPTALVVLKWAWLASAVPFAYVAARRLHDVGLPAWLQFVPVGLLHVGETMRQLSLVATPNAWDIIAPMAVILLILAVLSFVWVIGKAGFEPGTKGPNRYGPDTRDRTPGQTAP